MKKLPPQFMPKVNNWTEHQYYISIDVSTKKHPNISAKISKSDLQILTDGLGKWVAWCPNGRTVYVVRRQKGKTVYLHRTIMTAGDQQIDHISGDATDNRRENLRAVSDAENKKNLPLPITNTSGFIGVTKDKRRGGYIAQLQINKKCIHIGAFPTAQEASAARMKRQKELSFHPNHGRRTLGYCNDLITGDA